MTVPDHNLVLSLFAAVRTAAAYASDHGSTTGAVERLGAELKDSGLPLRMQFVGEAAFIDRNLVSVPFDDYAKVVWLIRTCNRCGADEIEFGTGETDVLLKFVNALAVGAGAQRSVDALEALILTGIRWRSLPYARLGETGESVDPEIFALAQLALAVSAAEQVEAGLSVEKEWPWSGALVVIRRLESALDADSTAAVRGLELAPEVEWNASRCATSAARCVLQALSGIGVPQSLRRAVAHAAFALVLVGCKQGHTSPGQAAEDFTHRASSSSVAELSVSAHRIRTLAAMRSISVSEHPPASQIGPLLTTMYGLELARFGAPHPPPRVELLAMGLRKLDDDWMRVVVQVEGALPSGSRVRLADGRTGVVLGPSENGSPWKPLVLVESKVVTPTQDVTLVIA